MQRSTFPARPRRDLGRRVLAAAVLLCIAPLGAAKDKAASDADGWHLGSNHLGIQQLRTPGIDRDMVELEDMRKFEAGEPSTRFAIAHTNKVAPLHYGTWDAPAADTRRWRIVLSSPKAVSINLGFTRFRLPEGAELTLLDKSGKAQFRSFTAADNDKHGQLWTPLVTGDEVTVVLTVPAKAVDDVQLEIGSINHGYRGLGETPWFAKSGSCNVDVVCPEGDDWRDQIRSVAALTLNGVDQCSGALVNNTEGDLKPYFLTANHCEFSSTSGAAGMVAYWNFENSVCRAPGSAASGGPGDGQRTQFNTGAIFRAARAASDFALVEFDDPIDPEVNPYWAGIDARDQVTPSSVAIHHPGVDEKRISFDDEPTTIANYGTGTNSHLRIADWNLGTTEGGSSGSPLFSPEKRIVGQLHGGGAACGNDLPDYYGRVAQSWAAGGTPATQLKSWLDPNNTGVLTIDGRNEVEAPFDLAIDPTALEVCTASTSSEIDITVSQAEPGFVDPVTLSVTDAPAGATATFDDDEVVPPGTAVLTLGYGSVSAGSYTVGIDATDGTDTVTRNLALTVATAAPGAATLQSPAAGATGVSTSATLTWTAVAQASGYRVEVDDSADFSSPVFDETVEETTVVVPGLDVETEYHWRVTASNTCGTGTVSAVATFTTGTQYCDATGGVIPDNAPTAGLVRTIVVPPSASAEITDLLVGLEITHTYMGDVDAVLSKDGVSVALLGQPSNCSGNDADITLDDAATLTTTTNCTAGADPAPAFIDGESYRPGAPLAGFDGEDIAGTWTLTVTDGAAQDDGTLDGWCLIPATTPFVNAGPVAGTIDDVATGAGDAFTLDAGAAFSDPNEDVLTFTATGLPAWASIDPATGVITGTPTLADVGESEVTVTATEDDPEGLTASATFTLTVYEVNLPPTFTAIPDVNAAAGAPFVFDAGQYFSDPNGDDLTFTAVGLPGWATLDPDTGVITGTPTAANIGGVQVTIHATESNPDGGSANDRFRLAVVDGTGVPVASPLPDETIEVDGELVIDAGAAFSDPDGDTLVFSAIGLPTWASIDPATGIITGIPAEGDEGEYAVTVIATEEGPGGLSASTSFTIVVTGLVPSDAIFADGFEGGTID